MNVKKVSLCIFVTGILFSCNNDSDPNYDETLAIELSDYWESYTQKFPDENINSAYFAIFYNNNQDSIVEAYGESMPGNTANVNDQLYLASTGKMLCSTVIMQLMEEGLLSLDDKISKYISAELMDGLHVYKGKDYSNEITIKQLLEHSSGIPDFIFDATSGHIPFIENLINNNLDSVWTPQETIEFSKKYQTPVAVPGKKHYYTDTGYNLLGLIIENITGKSLAEAYRERIFVRYGLTQSFMPYYETPVKNAAGGIWANTYFYDSNTGINWGEVDHQNVFSFEFGGGNWVASITDIHRYLRLLTEGNAFNNIETRNQMLTERLPAGTLIIDDLWYGYGMFIFDGKHGKIYGHGGANNTWAAYIPRYDAYVIIVLNQVETHSISSFFMLREIANIFESAFRK